MCVVIPGGPITPAERATTPAEPVEKPANPCVCGLFAVNLYACTPCYLAHTGESDAVAAG